MNLTALDIFFVALGEFLAALIGWIFVGDDDA
jgi:hypothetical protein